MTTNGPPPTECQILQFRTLFKLKFCHEASKNIYKKFTNLIAISALHDVTFLGERNGFRVVPNNKIFEGDHDFNSRTVIDSYLSRVISLPSSPTHIDINCDQNLLAVTFIVGNVPVLRIYLIDSLFHDAVVHYPEVRLSTSDATFVSDLAWNPGISNVLACCISDGTLSTFTFNKAGNFEVKSLPRESNSMCVCWSPKGKQIVVGNSNGYLTQYLPELKAVKNFPPPTDLFIKNCSLCSVKWLSNFQFIGVYSTAEQNLSEDDEIESRVVVINTPKNGPVTYVNYNDVCFSAGMDRPVQFYFTHIPNWNLILVSSSNSVEVAVLGLAQDNMSWIPWNLEPEENRITLPITKTGEAFPVGVALGLSPRFQTPVGDKTVSMPTLSVITCEGIICVYLVNFMNPSATEICVKPNLSSLQFFTESTICDEEQPVQNISQNIEPIISEFPQNQNSDATNEFRANISQVLNQIPDVSFSMPVTEPINKPFSIPAASNILNNSTSNLSFNAVTKTTANSETTPIAVVTKSPIQKQGITSTEQVTNIEAPKEVLSTVKKIDVAKARQEVLKKFKKRASVFENDIQEIKYLVSSIKLDDDKSDTRVRDLRIWLENEYLKMKDQNAELRNETDSLKTSVIEVFAIIQDAKSRYFQLMNPGYKSLTGFQDMDPININSLKTIENTINYIQTQVEKANKQLDEAWYKFTQNPGTRTMKVPLLENVYETIVKQQKILTFLKAQTDVFEKRFSSLIQRLAKDKKTVTDGQKDSNQHWKPSRLSNDSTSLEDLTKRALTLNSPEEELDPKALAHRLSREHAKRYHLSYAKQIKLQELLSTSDVTFIQSSRLQRLKKKSLIILSRTATSDLKEKEELVRKNTKEVPEVAPPPLLSPVSSEDDKVNNSHADLVISSTPLKSTASPRFSMESTLHIEPSIIKPITAAYSKTTFTIPSLMGINPLDIKPEPVQTKAAEMKTSSLLTTSSIIPTSPAPARKVEDEPASVISSFSLKPVVSTPSSLPASSPAPISPVTASVTIRPPGTLLSTTSSSMFNVPKPISSTSSTLLSTTTKGTIFSGAAAAPTVMNNPPATQTQNQPVAATSLFSFSNSKIEPAPLPMVSFGTGGSIFGTNPITVSSTSTNVPSSTTASWTVSDPGSKNVSSSGTLPSFGSWTATVLTSASPVVCSASSTISVAEMSTSVPVSTTSVFNGSSLFGQPSIAPKSTANFGSALSSGLTPSSIFSGKPMAAAALIITSGEGMQQKSAAFGSFSFANVNKSESSVTITEITSESGATSKDGKENAEILTVSTTSGASSVSSAFSFANAGLFSFAQKSESPVSSAISTPPMVVLQTSLFASPSTSTPSAVITSPALTAVGSSALTPAPTSAPVTSNLFGTALVSASPITAPAISTPVATPVLTTVAEPVLAPATTPVLASAATTTSATIDSSGSFFSGLSLGAVTTSSGPAPIFGKPATSSVPSMFSGSGGNIFSQMGNSSATTSTESKPIFGSGNATPLFGSGAGTTESKSIFGSGVGNATTSTETKNIFGSGSGAANLFQSGGSMFGSGATSGGSLFGSSSMFGNSNGGQSNSFGSVSGGSLFGSSTGTGNTGFGSPFQNTNAFGSSSPFSGGLQQQTTTSGGFGSPPTFGSSFNKTGSAFSTFGGAPAFGGAPSFGSSPTKVFGQTSNVTATFGAAAGQNAPGFEALANSENTVTFGNLAQQPSSGFGSPSAFGDVSNASAGFGAPPKFGNSSFSSWR